MNLFKRQRIPQTQIIQYAVTNRLWFARHNGDFWFWIGSRGVSFQRSRDFSSKYGPWHQRVRLCGYSIRLLSNKWLRYDTGQPSVTVKEVKP